MHNSSLRRAFLYLQLVRVTYRFNSPEFPDSSHLNYEKISRSSKYRRSTVPTDKYSKGRYVRPFPFATTDPEKFQIGDIMKCSIGYCETKVMITYEDLQQEAKSAADRNFEYIEVLRKHVRNFIDLYWQSLNVPGAPTFQDWNGNEERIITLGNVENGKFVKKYLHEFQVNDKFELPVIVKTIIKTDAMQSPWVTVPLVVKEEGGKVKFVIGGSDDATTCNIPAGDDIQVYSEAAELMKSIIVKMIKRTAPQ